MVAPPPQKLTDFRKQREDPLVGLRGLRGASGRLRQPATDLEVLADTQLGEDSAVLGRIADAQPGALVSGKRADVLSPKSDLPGTQRQESDDAVDRRRLPGAIAADETDRFLFPDRKRDLPEDLGPAAKGVDGFDFKHDRARKSLVSPSRPAGSLRECRWRG